MLSIDINDKVSYNYINVNVIGGSKMTQRIQDLLEYVRAKKHHSFRRDVDFEPAENFEAEKIPDIKRVTKRLIQVLKSETPVILPGERIVFTRTVKELPPVFTQQEWKKIKSEQFIHELGRVSNMCPDYETAIKHGLKWEKERCLKIMYSVDEKQKFFLRCVIDSIDAVLDLTERYRQKAIQIGNNEVAKILERVPAYGAENFHEALQFFRILHFTLWCEGEYHNTIGRLDQYMWPYFKVDIDSGKLDKNSALELLEEFFISFNKDSDLYPGIQQGDNGQSLMLGGVDSEGNEVFNALSELCLKASCELKLIDPKINIRVSSKTPLSVFEAATRLTREGLGFPQYSNDDVVIEGLTQKGYSLTDARNYSVAACWEFIIPKYGMDIPNIGAVNLPQVVNKSILCDLRDDMDYDRFFTCVKSRLNTECYAKAENIRNLYIVPAPFMSLIMDDCIERRQDISMGARYNNFGFHGVGISTAVDTLYAIKNYVFDEKAIDIKTLQKITADGFEGHDSIFEKLRYETPKFGDDDDKVDKVAVALIKAFGDAVKGLKNERGGCFRAGTGSAMFYLWYAKDTGCTFSGSKSGENFPANYSPELFARSRGPLSVIRSFTKPDLKEVINGGPLTLEFHSSVFSEEDGISKVAQLAKQFINMGGHQLQLNTVNRESLLDAQKHPENYQYLIVRVWGWSAYFVELDREYQDHVISRQEYSI